MKRPVSWAVGMLSMAALVVVVLTADRMWLGWFSSDGGKTTAARKPALPTELANAQPTSNAASLASVTEGPATEASPQSLGGEDPLVAAQIRDAFGALWLVSQSSAYKVRYRTYSAGGDEGDSYLVFNQPPSARVDTITAGSNDPASEILLSPDGSTVACSFDGGDATCGKIDAFDGPLPLAAGPIVFPSAPAFGSLRVGELEGRTIAGAQSRCFHVLSDDAAGAADYCFSAENVPVYGQGTFGTVEATELSTPSSTDFAVPTP